MKIRVMSDLHADPAHFYEFELQPLDSDKDTVLVLCGDVAEQTSGVQLVADIAPRFKHVIWLLGNHEYYNGNIKRTPEKIRAKLDSLEVGNVSVVVKDTVCIDDVVFVCAVLWTDFNGQNPVVMMAAAGGMNDYRKIRCGPDSIPWKRKITPNFIYVTHKDHLSFIKDQVAQHSDKKVVVVTHHAPSLKSIDPQYYTHNLNHCYFTELHDFIYDSDIKLWAHGHTHNFVEYDINGTQVVCNPRGYQTLRFVEQTNFDPVYSFDV